MNIENLLISLEDLSINKPEYIHALYRAAEISPFVNGRTIGPDIVQPYEDEINSEHDKDKENVKGTLTPIKKISPQKHAKRSSPNISPKSAENDTQIIESPTSPLNVSSLQNLDLETIVVSIRLREAENKRPQHLRKCALELQEKRKNLFAEQIELKKVARNDAHNDLISKKSKQDEIIRTQAKMMSDKQLEEEQAYYDAQHKKMQRQLQGLTCQVIVKYQRRFREIYEQVSKLILAHEAKAEHNAKVKQLVQMFDQLITKVKTSNCGVQDLQVAEKLCKTLESLEQFILDDFRHDEEAQIIKEQQEQQQQQQQQEEQQKQQQEQQELKDLEDLKAKQQQQLQLQKHQEQQQQQQQPQQENVASVTTPSEGNKIEQPQQQINATNTTIAQQASAERFKFYTHITTLYHEKVERVKPLQADESYKKFRFACQKAINIPVNAISSVNAQHLRDKFEKLYSLISGQIVKNADMQFSINDHALGRDYCLLLMAKKFVNQGDTAVSSNPQAAFPIASIIVSLWKSVPEFGKIFLAYIFKESPFLVPYFIPQQPQQTLDDYYKVLGYRSNENQLEPQEMYLKRQSGITRLYAAVMVTGSAAVLNVAPHPYGIEHAWRWLCNFVMLDPLPDICATIIQEMLQTVGNELWSTYGKQFVKLLIYIQQQYFPRLSAVDAGGPKARLELLLNKYIKEGQICKPQGILPPNFW